MYSLNESCASCIYSKVNSSSPPCDKCNAYSMWVPNYIKQTELVNMKYADYVYDIIAKECADLDSIYGDYICKLVGECGLNALVENNLIEGCGILNGRKLYVLCDKPAK